MTDNKELIDTVMELRSKAYPHLPETMVLKIIEIEEENQDHRREAIKKIKKVIEEYIPK